MATGLTGVNFEAKYNEATSGLYKTGQVDGIGSDDHRDLVTDIKDNFYNKTDGLTGQVNLNGVLRILGSVGVSPSSNQNNLDPSSFSTTANIILITPTGTDVEITGLVSGSLTGKIAYLYNISPTYWVTLKNENGSSTDVNRFLFGQDVILEPQCGIELYWGGGDSRWRTTASIGIQTKKTIIDSTAILSLNSSPVDLIPAPGAGKLIVPISNTVRLDYGTTPYATNTNLQTYLNGPSAIQVDYSNTILAATSDAYHTAGKATTAFTSQDLTNVAYKANVLTGNPTAGDSDITIYTTYKIITV